MNKKLMTLGVAAAVGLAGFAALPVLAANVFDATNVSKIEVMQNGEKYYALVDKANTGKITVDGSDFDKAVLKEYIEGKKFDGKIPTTALKDTEKDAKGAPVSRNVSGVKALEITGTTANVFSYLEAAKVMKVDYEDRTVAESVKEVVIKPTDITAAEFKDANYKILVDFLDAFKNAKVVLDLGDKDLDLSALTAYAPKELKGKFTVKTTGKVTLGTEVKKKAILENMEVKAGSVVVDGKISVLPEEKPEIKPEDKKDDEKKAEETKKAEEAAGNKTKVADKKGLKAPDTGIVK